MYNNRRFKPGYAIAEVLLAMVIISISFLQLSRSLASVMGAAVQNINVARAINLAHSTLEEIMAQSFDAKGSEAGDYALIFDGDDFVSHGNVFNGIQTISFWLQVDGIEAERTDYVIDLDGTKNIRVVGGTIISDITSPTYYVNAKPSVTTIAAVDTWYHVAVTTGTPLNVSALQIGKLGSNAAAFSGRIDEIRMWNSARSAPDILANYKRGLANPYDEEDLKLYLRMNKGSGSITKDHSSNMAHGTITETGDDIWTGESSSWSTILGTEGEASWGTYDDVDDFNGKTFTHDYYTGLGGIITVVYVDVNETTWAVTNPSSSPTSDYKQITVRVNIPGGDAYTQLHAIKSAKLIQNYSLTYSPYGD
jgi:type II secretory pathway pseudopilin PulG